QPGSCRHRARAVVRPGRAARLRARLRSVGARPERLGERSARPAGPDQGVADAEGSLDPGSGSADGLGDSTRAGMGDGEGDGEAETRGTGTPSDGNGAA